MVKVLAISDKVVDGIYSPQVCERFGDIDLVLGCGDLPYSYMEFIATMLNVPCFFVHGNHDHPEYTARGGTLDAPGGWMNIDGRVVSSQGIVLAGLEGSIQYNPGAPYQYTETEMMLKIGAMMPALAINRAVHGRYVDILVTHSPVFGILDGEDRAHRGFKAFIWFMRRFRPRLLLHGHEHLYGVQERRARYLDTEIVNVYPYHVVEWDVAPSA